MKKRKEAPEAEAKEKKPTMQNKGGLKPAPANKRSRTPEPEESGDEEEEESEGSGEEEEEDESSIEPVRWICFNPKHKQANSCSCMPNWQNDYRLCGCMEPVKDTFWYSEAHGSYSIDYCTRCYRIITM